MKLKVPATQRHHREHAARPRWLAISNVPFLYGLPMYIPTLFFSSPPRLYSHNGAISLLRNRFQSLFSGGIKRSVYVLTNIFLVANTFKIRGVLWTSLSYFCGLDSVPKHRKCKRNSDPMNGTKSQNIHLESVCAPNYGWVRFLLWYNPTFLTITLCNKPKKFSELRNLISGIGPHAAETHTHTHTGLNKKN